LTYPVQGIFDLLIISARDGMLNGFSFMTTEFYCVIVRDGEAERIEVLDSPRVTIGRKSESDIWLADANVSRLHAILSIEAGHLVLTDSGSRNGTIVNSQRVASPVELRDGSEIRIGPYTLLIFDSPGKALRQLGDTTQTTNSLSAEPKSPKIQIHFDRLTPSQQRVLECFFDGLSEKEVATRLHLSVHTVHSHAKAIYKSLEVSSRAELLKRRDQQTDS
jgi:pSer/pThr/pTyr-binding forkhead associated (FHA) protein